MEFAEQALVVRVGRFREIDAWVRFLTPTRGLLTAFAFGGMRSRRRFPGCLEPLSLVHFKVRRDARRGYVCLTEGRLAEAHPGLRTDPARLGMGVNCLKFFEAVPVDAAGAGAVFALVAGSLGALERAPRPAALFPALFRARLAMEQGFFPSFAHCGLCGAPLGQGRSARLDVARGRLACPGCRLGTGAGGLFLGPEALSLAEMAARGRPDDWTGADPRPDGAREFRRAVDALTERHMGLVWQNGGYARA